MPDERLTDIESFVETLPDPVGARIFWERLKALPAAARYDFGRDSRLLARLLTLAAYSPYLAETLLRHPEQITWLERETRLHFDRVKSAEQMAEDLAREATRMVDSDYAAMLGRFKRRELLRIYLRDCAGVATLSEVTEELSNLADVILGHALALAQQELANAYGSPLARDERGRASQAELAILSLGKLGCRELNYASDIDLMFLYAGEGRTTGDGRSQQSIIDNKVFFTAVANRVVHMIGSNAGEGSVYRIDLRLRPYGRDGDMVWEVARAAAYYREKAQNWERLALIRARVSAGSHRVGAAFLDSVRGSVFALGSRADARSDLRRIKEKIDRRAAARAGGFDVKLGRGGIREIEFIAQALQLEHGGREPWIRSAQTLIVLARLAEKSYLTENERARLSSAYTFLRTVEHRLQMEHGAQTHRLPIARDRLELLARRSGYTNAADPAGQFLADLEAHTAAVRSIYNRIFAAGAQPEIAQAESPQSQAGAAGREALEHVDDEAVRLIKRASAALARLARLSDEAIESVIASRLPSVINPLRALRNLSAWAESFWTYARDGLEQTGWDVTDESWPELIRRLLTTLASQYLSHILVSRPALAGVLVGDITDPPPDLYNLMREAVERERAPSSKADALRRAWYRQVIEIGYEDMSGASRDEAHVWRLNNLKQTALAEAALRLALDITLDALGLRPAPGGESLPVAILALGRLGHAGMDYGSDLDLLVVYDDESARPPESLGYMRLAASAHSPQEFYARLTSQLVQTLSSITREGLLYRIDLRLRPDGASGPVAQGLGSLVSYLAHRASAWEHSAYLKVREVAGDLRLGQRARRLVCETILDAAARNESLREDLRAMRARLEREKARQGRPNIKWGAGGMTDVYFITRYLQLRERIVFPTERGTTALILHLGERGALDATATEKLYKGYSFLRSLDHWMRLLLDRPGPVLPASLIAMQDLARALGLGSSEELERSLAAHRAEIREVFDLTFN